MATNEPEVPFWLDQLDLDEPLPAFPVNDALPGSVFYPSSNVDGRPVAFLGRLGLSAERAGFCSFVYVDWSLTSEQQSDAIRLRGFRGYSVGGERRLLMEELTPRPWDGTPSEPIRSSDRSNGAARLPKDRAPPFAHWYVFRREAGFSADHGPSRFSLLHVCAEGVAAFDALFRKQGLVPDCVALISPGDRYGDNWASFLDPQGHFARTVMGNPAGSPRFLMQSRYPDAPRLPSWPQFAEMIGAELFLEKQLVSLWARS